MSGRYVVKMLKLCEIIPYFRAWEDGIQAVVISDGIALAWLYALMREEGESSSPETMFSGLKQVHEGRGSPYDFSSSRSRRKPIRQVPDAVKPTTGGV